MARNVTLQDVIDTQGVRLLKDSVILMDEKGNVADADVQINDDNTFLMSTGRTLVRIADIVSAIMIKAVF